MKITATPLYQAISKKLNNHERQELITALQAVKDMPKKHVRWDCEELIDAFGWMGTPIGYQYWSKLYNRVNHAD